MGQRIRYPDRHSSFKPAALAVHKGEYTGVPYKCDESAALHHFRLNARPGDRCFCGQTARKADGNA